MAPRILRALGLGLTATLCGCAHLVTLAPVCGSGRNAAVCMTPTRIPEESAETYKSAVRQAIDVASSPEFADGFAQYVARAHRGDASFSEDWKGVSATQAIADLRSQLARLDVATYGGIRGWGSSLFLGTRAREGETTGPILINRFPSADASDLVNSIVHEAAHRAGLTHLHGDRNCGPPYILGALAERISRAEPSQTGCAELDPPQIVPAGTR